MKKLEIEEVNGTKFLLRDEDGNLYRGNFEIYGLNKIPKVKDIMYLNEDFLEQLNDNLLSFGPITTRYGTIIEKENDFNLLVYEKEDRKGYFKKFYG